MGTLLEAISIVLETYFGFGFPNAYAIGDSLNVTSRLTHKVLILDIDFLWHLDFVFLSLFYTYLNVVTISNKHDTDSPPQLRGHNRCHPFRLLLPSLRLS